MALLLYTGQRRGDVVKMGPQHVPRRRVHDLRQQKDRRADGRCRFILNWRGSSPPPRCGNLVFLVTQFGKSFARRRIWQRFSRLVQRGRIAAVLGAWAAGRRFAGDLPRPGVPRRKSLRSSGHRSLKEVQRYIEMADRSRLAAAGMARLSENETGEKLPNHPAPVRQLFRKNPMKSTLFCKGGSPGRSATTQ